MQIVTSPIKVCMHVLGAAPTDVRVMREAIALVEKGLAVSIVDIDDEPDRPAEEVVHGVSIRHVLVPHSFTATRFTRWALVRAAKLLLLSTLRVIRTPADIYHAHDISGLPACYIAARFRRKPLIYDAHEMPLAELSSKLFQRVRPLLSWLLAIMVSRCAGVITISPPIAQEIRKRYHVPTVTLVRNIAPYREVPRNDRLRERLGLAPSVRIALYQGNLQANRCLDVLVRSAAFLDPDIVIVMMGQGRMQSELEALISSEGVADRVRMIPPVPYEELLDWTASADLGLIVYPPQYSLNVQLCLPNKIFEYLIAGVPVLASQLDAVADIINTYDVGQIVPSLAPSSVGATISSILSDPAALARMHRNALLASQQDLSWEKEADELISLYHKVLRTYGAIDHAGR
jgi:glycosyltransferase involved in cell wall biosynthesis